MNIFLFDANLSRNASYFPDKLIINQPKEHCQMIAAAFAELELGTLPKKDGSPYGITHKNHPCVCWAGSSLHNVYYIARLGLELCLEYEQNYGRQHGCYGALFYAEHLLHSLGASLELTDEIFPIAVGDDCRAECAQLGFLEHPAQKAGTIEQAIACYRHYMLSRKLHYACWSRSAVPAWWPASDSSHSEYGWLSCKLSKSKFSKVPLLMAEDNGAISQLKFEPLQKQRRTSSPKAVKQQLSPNELGVPLFTMEIDHAELRKWLATKLSSKLPTLGTIGKWHAQCIETGGSERLRLYLAEHYEYWRARGHGIDQ